MAKCLKSCWDCVSRVMVTKPSLRAVVPLNKQRCSTAAPNSENKIPAGSFRLTYTTFSQGSAECLSFDPLGSASGYSAPLSGLICLEPNLTLWLQLLVALSNICACYLPGPMPSMIPNTATWPCLVPDQEPVVLARLPYSISLLRSYSTENKGV